MIPYAKQNITEDDIEAAVDVLKSDWLTQGPSVQKFEQRVSDYVGAKYSTAVNSATSALHISCLALGVQKGDWVWTSPNTFVASANCAIYCGANIDFIDINLKTFNIDIQSLVKKLEYAKKNKILPKVIIPVHFSGQPCDMSKIHELSKIYKFKIIEDASHAIGAKYNDIGKKFCKIGSCKHSDITVFSFHPVKIITTAEGGIATTNNKEINNKLKIFRTNGVTRDKKLMVNKSKEKWYYEQVELGYNYRMNDLQAAIGCKQIERLDKYVSARHKIADTYKEGLNKLDINLPYQERGNFSSFHLYVITFKNESSQKIIYNKLQKLGIGVNVHYIPVHTQPYYKKMGFRFGDFPKSENYYKRALSLPMYPTLSKNEQDYVIDCVAKSLK
jgi:UDP-4-amino-4,6-dideoxy-N-acetyl-beta-L-altrosamine transaminase